MSIFGALQLDLEERCINFWNCLGWKEKASISGSLSWMTEKRQFLAHQLKYKVLISSTLTKKREKCQIYHTSEWENCQFLTYYFR